MVKKNSSNRKANEESPLSAEQVSENTSETAEVAASATPLEETPPPKSAKAKGADDQSASGSVGLSDIRKAVAFANSVGGLDKAIALLQIVKVAKEVQ
ncbi:MAG TPA: hypothetical protein PLY87_12900 [Planctomycetaceae bacterium]|nr:hypothetical protein [Planctomycetaceae bacterium]HRA87750.1 hypothetical protein [Planctomycetaceae bacterium]